MKKKWWGPTAPPAFQISFAGETTYLSREEVQALAPVAEQAARALAAGLFSPEEAQAWVWRAFKARRAARAWLEGEGG